MQGIVCALERRPIDAAVVGLAADLAARLGGALHVVVNESGVDAHDLGVDAQVHVLDVPTDEGLALVADEERAGLVVVGPVDESDSSPAVEVPVAIALAALGERPVVVLTAAAELHFGSGYYELTPAANGPGRA
jgi:hypothetical protein